MHHPMKTVHLFEISPSRGHQLSLTATEDWVKEVMKNVIGTIEWEENSLKGVMDLRKTNDIVNINTDVEFTVHPLCARCGKELTFHKKICFHSVQAPLEKPRHSKNKENQEDIELTDDDLNFGYYENDQVNVEQILNDEIALSLPYNYYCDPKTACQAVIPPNSNITFNDGTDPRWAVLKNLKKNTN